MKNISKKILLAVLIFSFSTTIFARKSIYVSKSTKQEKSATAGCSPATATIYLDFNNVKALIMNGGDMWWDQSTGNPAYEVPKGSGKMANFLGSIWIGGTDANGQLRLAAIRYRQNGVDYWPGPLITSGPERASITPDVCEAYDKFWVITKAEVAKFRTYITALLSNNTTVLNDPEFQGYQIPQIIYDWPAHGDVSRGYDYHLAPFVDVDGDDYYNPDAGDYPFYDLDNSEPCGTSRELRKPKLYGDKTIWWVYNDKGNIHTETNGAAIGMEIRAQAFAFSTNDELNNMTFGHYELINRSTYTLFNTYFGVNTDADLGSAADDYVGCDVNRGLGYCYNGDDDDDGEVWAYGPQPPAIGIDFFEGPYQDPDGKDNKSNWDTITGNLDCARANLEEGSINGLNFEDGIVDNERWGMRRFVYYINGGPTGQGDPEPAVEYYNYLRGYWTDNTRMTYGGTGHLSSSIETDFLFPDVSDPCGWGTSGNPQPQWSEITDNNPPRDKRFVQSAGPFTLEPGAVNDITEGIVWARASTGGAWASVAEVQRADDKAQKLFENCFKVVDGPDAPELTIIEMNQQLIFHIWNKKGSNNYRNYPEDYSEKDPFIVCPTDNPSCDKFYKFEGYQVFQLKDASCSVSDIGDEDKARLVYQCDIENYDKSGNPIGRLINFEYDEDLGASKPVLKVDGENKGIKHSFVLTEDKFATGDKRLVNYKTYYYVAIAYGYNLFKKYDNTTPEYIDGQSMPYKSSRKGGDGQAIKIYDVVPHLNQPENNGTTLPATYGYGPKITQIEGHGNSYNELDLTQETINEILENDSAEELTYKNGYGPIKVKVIDPLNVPDKDFVLAFDSVQYTSSNGNITKAKWKLYSGNDTVYSNSWITYDNEQLIPEWGLSVEIKQSPYPGNSKKNQNGFINATMTWSDDNNAWLSFIPDQESVTPLNWIRSGTVGGSPGYNDAMQSGKFVDSLEFFEGILQGKWGPYCVCSTDNGSSSPNVKYGTAYYYRHDRIQPKFYRIGSVDIVITSDKSKWTRCPVIEMCEFDTSTNSLTVGLSEGGAWKFGLRRHASVDKSGKVYATTGSGASTNPNDPNYIAEDGMGWFPGYAIDIETGERLNMAFGEDSRFPAENGRDMIWNPTSDMVSDLYQWTGGANGDIYAGGKHYIYVFGHTVVNGLNNLCPMYDGGKWLHDKLENTSGPYDFTKGDVWKNAMWVALPILKQEYANYDTTDPYGFIKSDLEIKLRMANPYCINIKEQAKANPQNNNWPLYKFSTKDIATETNDVSVAKDALEKINVVPNPYYAYNEYELTQLEKKIKFTNLPQTCTINIYNVNGSLIRTFKKDNELTWQDWNLTNESGITIAGGVYIIHIEVPGVGEKVLKWFGALRPIDLNNF